MPTVHFGKRAGRTRGRPEDRATADGLVSVKVFSSGTTEVEDAQLITLVNAFGGTFTLLDASDETSAIAYDAAASVLNTRIEADFTTDGPDVGVTGSAGGPWTVAYEGDVGPKDDLTGDVSSITATTVVVTEAVKGVANVYEITHLESDATGGTIVFTHDGNDTSALAYDVSSGDLDTALQGLASITDVAVSGTGQSGTPWIVTFADPAGNVGAITVDMTSATKAASTTVATPTPGVDEVDQVVELDNDSTSGTFTILFDGEETDPLTFDAAASLVKQELQELSGITDVTVTGIGTDANPWIVTFVDPPAAVATFTADDSNLNGGATTTVINVTQTGLDRVDEIQSIHVGNATSGTFTVSHSGDTTGNIDWDEEGPTDLKAILEAITAITTVNVTGTGQSGDPWLIEFIDPSGAEDEVTTTDTNLFTDGVETITVPTPGVDAVNEQQLVTVNNGTGGTYKLTYDSQEMSTGVAPDVTAAAMETKLELLSSITAVTVTGADGGPYTVEFVTPGSADLGMMTADITALTGAAASIVITATVAGVVNVNETQLFTVDGDTGTYTLLYDDVASTSLAAAANAATIKTALETIGAITTVTVTGAGSRKNPFKVAFSDPVGDVLPLVPVVTSLSNTVVVAARAQGSADDRE